MDAAAAIADADGIGALTLAAVAGQLNVRVPSLYNHLAGLDDLRRELRLRGLHGLGSALRDAAVGRAGSEALAAIAGAQRAYAKRHPGLYAAASAVADSDGPAVLAAADEVLGVVLAVLRGYGLEGPDALHAVRCLRAAVGGFVALELGGGFGLPLEVDESFGRLVRLLDRGLRDERAAKPA